MAKAKARCAWCAAQLPVLDGDVQAGRVLTVGGYCEGYEGDGGWDAWEPDSEYAAAHVLCGDCEAEAKLALAQVQRLREQVGQAARRIAAAPTTKRA